MAFSIKNLMNDVFFLYFVTFLAVANIIGYIAVGNSAALLIFIISAITITQFSKNMISILGGSTVIMNFCVILFPSLCDHRSREGLENIEDAIIGDDQEIQDPELNTHVNAMKKLAKGKGSDKKAVKDAVKKQNKFNTESDSDEGFEPAENKKKKGPNIDHASTLEDAYNDLDKMLGSDGIKNLTADTQILMKQQQKLYKTMESMTPLLTQAKQMMAGFDVKGISGLSGLTDALKNEKK